MKTPGGRRPAAWEPRQRIIAAVVGLVVVVAGAGWWVLSADSRRESAACDLYQEQQGPLRDLLRQVTEAAEASAEAGDTTVLPYFDNADSTLNTMRRWQSTEPRVLAELDDSSDRAVTAFTDLTDAVAELQRVIETDVATAAAAYVPEVEAQLDDTDALCA